MGNSRIKITEVNITQCRIGPNKKVKLKIEDLDHIVYGKDDDSVMLVEKPKKGTKPYFKVPDEDVWFKVYIVEE